MSPDGIIAPDAYLTTVDVLLSDDAAAWAESDPEVFEILNAEMPNEDAVCTFKNCFLAKFPTLIKEPAPVSFNMELSEM